MSNPEKIKQILLSEFGKMNQHREDLKRITVLARLETRNGMRNFD